MSSYLSHLKFRFFSLLILEFALVTGLSYGQAAQCTTSIALPDNNFDRSEIRFAALGDTGTGCDAKNPASTPQCALSNRIAAVQENTKFNLLFLLGDNVYETGNPKGLKSKLFDPYKKLALEKGVLLKGVLGNHDVLSHKGSGLQMKFFNATTAANQRKFFDATVKEQIGFPDAAERYYKFQLKNGLVEFFALDSSMLTRHCCGVLFWKRKFTEAERRSHIAWLRTELGRSKARWKIVLLHHPFYSSALAHGVKLGNDGSEIVPKKMRILREEIEPLLKDNSVQLVLAGHDHVYEYILPQHAGGISHFVSGAGAKLREKDFDSKLPTFHGCGESKKYSFLLFSVTPQKITFWTIDKDGSVIHSGEIQ